MQYTLYRLVYNNSINVSDANAKGMHESKMQGKYIGR